MSMPVRTIVTSPYKQIETDLRHRIENGEWAPGMMIPSRRALAAEYHVELPTVQRAVAGLLKSNVLRADGGRGTFVAESVASRLDGVSELSSISTGRLRSPASDSVAYSRPATVGLIYSSRFVHADGRTSDNAWGHVVAHSIERTLSQNGDSTRYVDLSDYSDINTALYHAAKRQVDDGVDALVILGARGDFDYFKPISEVYDLGLPLVVVGGLELRLPLMQVFFDDRDAGQHIGKHLIEQGATRLAFLAPFTENWVTARMEGVREAMSYHGKNLCPLDIRIDPHPPIEVMDRIRSDENQERLAYENARHLLSEGVAADGVIAANDLIAYGFIRAATEARLEMGRDYLIAGFDDDPKSRAIGLTTMRPPLEAMGEEAARLLCEMQVKAQSSRRICMQSHLIVRNSTSLE